MITLKRFNQSDWYGFSGARCFRDGSSPLIGTVTFKGTDNKGLIVVIDHELCTFMDFDANEEVSYIGENYMCELANLLFQLEDTMSVEDARRLMQDYEMKPWF